MTTPTQAPMRVAQASQRTGLSGHTLRYYEQEGLLPDAVSRDGAGHRVYSEDQVQWLLVCTKLRSSGMSLDHIRRYAELQSRGSDSVRERYGILREHEQKVRDQLAELQEALEIIERKTALTPSGWPTARRTSCGAAARSAAARSEPGPDRANIRDLYDQVMAEMWVCSLGEIDYRSALELQERLRTARQQELIPDTLLLLEHNPAVYTRGRRSDTNELTMGEAWYAQRGIEIIETRRGGKVTYHGPGQLVGYPIVRVDDVVAYVRLLEQTLVDALAQIGVSARARPDDGPDYTGVWVESRKIASIGVHVAHGITTHGFAINVQARALEPFTWVVACGLPGVTMTSIESEGADHFRGTDDPAALERFAALTAASLAHLLGHECREVTVDELEKCLVSPTSGAQSAGTLSIT